MKTLMPAILGLLTLSPTFALGSEGEETRTDKTSNTIVISVGSCLISRRLDFNNVEIYESTLPVTNCQEYKTYRANVTGKFWNQTVTPIPGTETYTYKLEDDTQVSAGGPTADGLNYFKILQACEEKRELLKKLANAQQGQAKCTL